MPPDWATKELEVKSRAAPELFRMIEPDMRAAGTEISTRPPKLEAPVPAAKETDPPVAEAELPAAKLTVPPTCTLSLTANSMSPPPLSALPEVSVEDPEVVTADAPVAT
jgi:hypothetical protein